MSAYCRYCGTEIDEDDIDYCSGCGLNGANILRSLTGGVEAIRKERERQKNEERWTAAHDDKHTLGELGQAAAAYAMPVKIGARIDGRFLLWPSQWDRIWWKPTPSQRKRELEKAGALIAAEWDRIDRLEHKKIDLPKRSELKPRDEE
jgi:hypothetical protein